MLPAKIRFLKFSSVIFKIFICNWCLFKLQVSTLDYKSELFNVYSLHSSVFTVSGLEMIIDWYVFVLKIQFYIVFYLLLFNFMCYFHCPNSSSEC